MAWHDDFPKYIIENDEPVPAQAGDEATHVLMPISVIGVHEAFYKVAIAERNFYRAGGRS